MSYNIIYNLSELQTYLAAATHIAFDFETSPLEPYRHEEKSALDAHKAHITGISFSITEGDAVYLPLTHRTGQNAADQPAIWQWLADEVFANPAITKIAHNLAFESAFLYARGIIPQEPLYDTITAAQMIYKNEKVFRGLSDCGLKTLVPEFFHEELSTFSETTAGLHFDELDPAAEKTVRYACADADYALRLYHLLNNWFDRFLPKHRYIVEKIESPTAVYCGLMRYNGLPVDRSLMERKRAEAQDRLAVLRGEMPS